MYAFKHFFFSVDLVVAWGVLRPNWLLKDGFGNIMFLNKHPAWITHPPAEVYTDNGKILAQSSSFMSEYLLFWQLVPHPIIQAWGKDLNIECWGFFSLFNY